MPILLEKRYLNIANIISTSRIIISFLIIFTKPFSYLFYIFYLLSGISDILDGYIARKFHQQSDLGAKLDTIADMVFFFICFLKIYSFLNLEWWMLIWLLIIFCIKISTILINRKMIAIHSVLNK